MVNLNAVMTDSRENEPIYDFLKKEPAKLENTYKLGWNFFILDDFDDFSKVLGVRKKGYGSTH